MVQLRSKGQISCRNFFPVDKRALQRREDKQSYKSVKRTIRFQIGQCIKKFLKNKVLDRSNRGLQIKCHCSTNCFKQMHFKVLKAAPTLSFTTSELKKNFYVQEIWESKAIYIAIKIWIGISVAIRLILHVLKLIITLKGWHHCSSFFLFFFPFFFSITRLADHQNFKVDKDIHSLWYDR